MKTLWKVTLSALSFAAFTGLAGCVAPAEEGYDDNYGGGYASGYCDAWGCPDGYWDFPVYYGSIYYNGAWLDGPIYCRDIDGRRQFWVHGGWHNDGWRGERPAQYPAGRVGPALGRDFYRSANFRNGSGGNGARNGFRDNESGLNAQSFQGNGNSSSGGNSGNGNRGGGNAGNGGGRGFNGGGNRGGNGGGNNGGGGGYRGGGGGGNGGGGGGGYRGGGGGGGGGCGGGGGGGGGGGNRGGGGGNSGGNSGGGGNGGGGNGGGNGGGRGGR